MKSDLPGQKKKLIIYEIEEIIRRVGGALGLEKEVKELPSRRKPEQTPMYDLFHSYARRWGEEKGRGK